jgi:hypothetical protein
MSGAAAASGAFIGVDAAAPVAEKNAGGGRGRGRPGPKGRRIKRYIYDDDVDVVDAQATEAAGGAAEARKAGKAAEVKVRYRRERGTPILEGDLRDAAFDAVARAARDEGMDDVSIDLGRIIGLTDEQVRAELMAQIAVQSAEEEFILLTVV